MKKGRTIDQIEINESFESKKLITDEMIQKFAEATGDFNPIHLDEDFASATPFKKRIAHGVLSAGIISGVLGMQFPGVGTIYMSQTLKFMRPVFIGDEITVRLTVLEKNVEKNRLLLETVCENQNGDAVLKGEALVMPPK